VCSSDLIRLNCDVLLSELRSRKGSGPLFEGAKPKRKKGLGRFFQLPELYENKD
jgi:hypothetical protein